MNLVGPLNGSNSPDSLQHVLANFSRHSVFRGLLNGVVLNKWRRVGIACGPAVADFIQTGQIRDLQSPRYRDDERAAPRTDGSFAIVTAAEWKLLYSGITRQHVVTQDRIELAEKVGFNDWHATCLLFVQQRSPNKTRARDSRSGQRFSPLRKRVFTMSKSRKVQLEQLIEFFQYRKFLKSMGATQKPAVDAGEESIFADDGAAEFHSGSSSIMVCSPTQIEAETETKLF